VDYLGIRANDSILVIVPLFHANAWGIPYSAAMSGAKLVFPGPNADGKTIYELLRDEHVTFSCGVPTVWTMFFDYVDRLPPNERVKLSSFNRVVCGGSGTLFPSFVLQLPLPCVVIFIRGCNYFRNEQQCHAQ
jgi:acyl-CoA synthetase (AMP-forming)/AMP-acid ligase II